MANQQSAKREPARTIDDALADAEIQYAIMVNQLQTDRKLPQRIIGLVLTLAEKTPEDLIRDALSSDSPLPRAGGPCLSPECNGTLKRYRTKRHGRWATRYFRCVTCGATAKRVLPGASVHRRRRPMAGT